MSIDGKKLDPLNRKVLVVDDDPDSLEIIAEALSWEGYDVRKTISSESAIEMITHWQPDVAVLEVNMPENVGTSLLKTLKALDPFMAVMFISGNTSTEAVIAGLDAGADDYIAKPFDPLEMLARVRTQLRIKDLNNQLRWANDRLKELIDIDDLTGLFNMRSVYQKIEQELERSRRFHRHCCVVMMDMDKFKSVNDGHDHLFGSFVLSEVGKIIQHNIRNIDIAARYGGDEFLIVLTETNREGAMIFCERLRESIEGHQFQSDKDKIRLTASIGFAITTLGDTEMDAKSLVRIADNALYEAKRAGRNQVKATEIPAPPKGRKQAG